ncbi:MAG: general secretion pathway protein GspE, partial [Desulfuromonadales bacterium]|nr:general secretion pathway protein GspE [Desulfuromonadales bacterium]
GRSALFLIRQQNASGWRGSAGGRPMADFAQLRIPLSEPSVFKTVTETRSWHLGPLPRTPFNSQFLQELGGEVPATVLLMPLLMMGRVIAILYVDGPASALQDHLHALQKLTAKMVMAFEVLILKNKIAML